MKTYTAQQLSCPDNAALLNEIVLLLAHAFTEDPSHKWLLGKQSRELYIKGLPHYLHYTVLLALSCDAIVRIVTSDEFAPPLNLDWSTGVSDEPRVTLPSTSTVRAVSITIPPHGTASLDSTLVSLRASGISLPLKCGLGIIWRLLTTWEPMLDRMHEKMFPDPATRYHNWCLLYIGVHLDCQGQGVGRKMLTDIQEEVGLYNLSHAEQAEKQGVEYVSAPLYLEASSLESKRLYDKVGFQDVCTGIYGTLSEGENVRVEEDGSVSGGRLFGMVWQPT